MQTNSPPNIDPIRWSRMSATARRRAMGYRPVYEEAAPAQPREETQATERPWTNAEKLERVIEAAAKRVGALTGTLRVGSTTNRFVYARTAIQIVASGLGVEPHEIAEALGMTERGVRVTLTNAANGRCGAGYGVAQDMIKRFPELSPQSRSFTEESIGRSIGQT